MAFNCTHGASVSPVVSFFCKCVSDASVCKDFIASVMDEWMNEWIWIIFGMVMTLKDWSKQRKTCHNVTVSITDPTWTDLG